MTVSITFDVNATEDELMRPLLQELDALLGRAAGRARQEAAVLGLLHERDLGAMLDEIVDVRGRHREERRSHFTLRCIS